ncbi:MAG: hypothetical protein R3212_14285, partial [Xanthomonadales bacterium]|nr:hypothetical protein [Xanthomonadales bacterium]
MTGTEAIFVIRRKSALFRAAFAVLLVAGSAAAQVPAPGEEAWTLEIPIDARAQTERCPFEAPASDEDLGPVFEYMKRGPVEAVACVNFLEEHTPGWHGAEGAEVLVAPFVEHLLGDGTARGMQRHTIFVDLLGHLEKIAPDWRWRPEVREKMPDIILASVVEDPFVADVWARTLPEMDGDWQQSDAARLLIPALYRLAVEQ